MQIENSPHPLRVLAVDDEYLIALGIQDMLHEYTSFQVDAELLSKFEDRLSTGAAYDIVIIDAGPLSLSKQELASRIAQTGAALVWSSASMPGNEPEAEAGAPPMCIPTVRKPFASDDLLRAIGEALSARHPEKARAVAALFEASGP